VGEPPASLIRKGVDYTSAVCVLIGTSTWTRPWVRYEAARAVIDGRGLLAVHINGIRHHQTKMPNVFGLNPLEFMAVGKVQNNFSHLLNITYSSAILNIDGCHIKITPIL
jgi:MTH538 TIR-like domain (DUF1863)